MYYWKTRRGWPPAVFFGEGLVIKSPNKGLSIWLACSKTFLVLVNKFYFFFLLIYYYVVVSTLLPSFLFSYLFEGVIHLYMPLTVWYLRSLYNFDSEFIHIAHSKSNIIKRELHKNADSRELGKMVTRGAIPENSPGKYHWMVSWQPTWEILSGTVIVERSTQSQENTCRLPPVPPDVCSTAKHYSDTNLEEKG